jgi:hypothetical protein
MRKIFPAPARFAAGVTAFGFGLACASAAMAQSATPPGPPQFVSVPIHAPEDLPARVEGWLTFAAAKAGGGGGDPPPAVPVIPLFSGSSETGTTPVDTIDPTFSSVSPYQGEPAIAVTPAGALVGGFNSIYPSNCSAALKNCAPGATVASISNFNADPPNPDNWRNSRVPLNGNVLGSDPSIAVDSADHVYFSYLVCSGSCSTANLLVATSTSSALLDPNNSQPWGTTAFQVTAPKSGVLDDKPWIAADPGKAGVVYVGWDRNQSFNQILYVTRSTNFGQTWSSPVKVNDRSTVFNLGRVIDAMPVVANDHASSNPSLCSGSVYVIWLDYAVKRLYVDKSTDCGAHWNANGKDVAVASVNVTVKDIGCNGGRGMGPSPYIAVDDLDPQKIYVAYADDKATGSRMDIYFVFSTDGGKTWSNPNYKLNDDGTTTDQFNPAMSVAGGQVHVSWLDRRDDPSNCLARTYSTAGSAPNFSPNYDVSQGKASDFDGNPNGPGDYTGNASYVDGLTNTKYGQPLFPTHLPGDIPPNDTYGIGFEIYSAQVTP